jgi:hypothetical protein
VEGCKGKKILLYIPGFFPVSGFSGTRFLVFSGICF